MGWTPKRNVEGSASGEATPASPRRRRRAKPAETETPLVDKAVEEIPRAHTSTRPRAGVNKAKAATLGEDNRPRPKSVRLGKRWSEVYWAIKAGEYTWAQFVEGLDEEELARGQLRDDEGGFRGRPPTLVPREFHLACQREMKRRFELLFQQDVLNVAREYLRLAQSTTLGEQTKAKMLQYAMERVFGGIPKDVTIRQEQPWESMVVNVMRTPDNDEMPDHLEERYARYSERQGAAREDEEE